MVSRGGKDDLGGPDKVGNTDFGSELGGDEGMDCDGS